jgi:hypothetical protein
MSSQKSTLKFNRKVYIIPAEKMSTTVQKSTDNENSNVNVENETVDNSIESKDVVLDPSATWDSFKNILNTDQYNNVMAISHMLHYNPEKNADDRRSLLFTQDITPAPKVPHDIVTLYHKVENAKIPKHLITNPIMRRNLQHMSSLVDYDITDEETETPMSTDNTVILTDSESGNDNYDDDDDDVLKKAWIFYAKEMAKKNKDKPKKKKSKSGKRENKKQKTSPKKLDTTVSKTVDAFKEDKSKSDWVHLF